MKNKICIFMDFYHKYLASNHHVLLLCLISEMEIIQRSSSCAISSISRRSTANYNAVNKSLANFHVNCHEGRSRSRSVKIFSSLINFRGHTSKRVSFSRLSAKYIIAKKYIVTELVRLTLKIEYQ